MRSLTQEDLPAAEARSRVERSINEDAVEVLKPTAPVQVPEHASLDEALRALREGGQAACSSRMRKDVSSVSSRSADVLDRVVLEEGGQAARHPRADVARAGRRCAPISRWRTRLAACTWATSATCR